VSAQTDVQNTGVLFISSGTDSFFIGGNFTNQSGSSFTNNGKFYLARNFSNSQPATPQGAGELILFGSVAQTVSTASNSPFNKLTINKTTNNATLASEITVNNELKFTAGKLSLSDYDLTMGNSATIAGAGSSSYIVAIGNGGLKQQVANNNNKVFPVGTTSYYTPATVALSLPSSTDVFKVRMLPAFYKNGANGSVQNSYVVNCLWLISETTSGGSNATLTLQWPSQLELTGFNRTLTRVAHYHNSDWDYGLVNINASGSDPYSATRSDITDFSPFGIANHMAVLSNDELPAEAVHENETNVITWRSVNGYTADHFEIDYSADGQNFSTLGTVLANSNEITRQQYKYVHSGLSGRIFYYRIKQFEKTGKIFYSKVLKVTLNNTGTVTLYPNPVVSTATIELNNTYKGIVFITVVDATGRILYSGQEVKNSTLLKTNLNVASYPKGVYKVILRDETGNRQLLQLVKN
jgi:hypothetical protein